MKEQRPGEAFAAASPGPDVTAEAGDRPPPIRPSYPGMPVERGLASAPDDAPGERLAVMWQTHSALRKTSLGLAGVGRACRWPQLRGEAAEATERQTRLAASASATRRGDMRVIL